MAQYLVMKRASIEPNFHGLYMSFLDQFGSVQLRKRVLKETYRNIKVRYIYFFFTVLLNLYEGYTPS